MIIAEIVLDKRRITKKGYPVKIRIYDTIAAKNKISNREYISLGIYQNNESLKLTPDLKRREIDLIDQVRYCNENLFNLTQAVNIIKNGIPVDDIDMEIQILEKRLELLRRKKGIEKEIGLIEFTDELIKERLVMNRPIDSYGRTMKRVKEFIAIEDIPINSITKEWINAFDIYYKGKGLKDTSIHTYIAIIKAIYKEAQSRESLNVKKENPFIKLRAFKKEKRQTSLTVEDLAALQNISEADLKRGNKIKTLQIIGLILFQFAVGGHDLIDMAVLEWKNINGKRIKFKRYKNRFKASEGEEVDNMLNDYALAYIEKYADKNSERLFTFLYDPRQQPEKYRVQQITLNSSMYPKFSKLIGSQNKFTSKSTRYLFRTAGGNLLIDSYIMMKLQGHTPRGVTFGYQGALNHEVQDREHQKILDLVFDDKCQ